MQLLDDLKTRSQKYIHIFDMMKSILFVNVDSDHDQIVVMRLS